MKDKPKIAIIHPQLREGGGSEARALRAAEALKSTCSVTLVTMGPFDLGRLNSIYGTRLSPDEISTVSLPFPRWCRGKFDALRGYRLGRWAKAKARDYDIMISAYNVMDFGKRGIQFIADFSYDDGLRRSFHPAAGGLKNFLYRRSPMRSVYIWLGKRLASQSEDGWRENWTFANSDWSRAVLERRFGLKCGVIYPPIQDAVAGPDWREKETGFVVLARMSREKRVEKAVEILAEVRRSGVDVHLHILGREDNKLYTREIRELCEKHADWAHYEGFVGGVGKMEFLSRHRYGLSACWNEAFGIAVAEMVKAGSIVWVPNGGGQVEIVGHEDLIYESVNDAARKILRVLGDEERQSALLHHLSGKAELYSSGRFMSETRRVVGEFMESLRSEGR